MNTSLVRKLISIRSDFEQKLIDPLLLADLYCHYTTLSNIDIFIERAQNLFPLGNCGLVSLYLRSVLKKGTIVRGYYDSHPHTFLRYDKNTIIDLTADQFGGPPVYCGPCIPPWTAESSLWQSNQVRLSQHLLSS